MFQHERGAQSIDSLNDAQSKIVVLAAASRSQIVVINGARATTGRGFWALWLRYGARRSGGGAQVPSSTAAFGA
jgi:hypothetical protein